jgi:exopolysaccharide biosynthesis polyprenyl glycosylphosphotransferase
MAMLADRETDTAHPVSVAAGRPGVSTERDAAGDVVRRLRRIWTTRYLVLLSLLDGAALFGAALIAQPLRYGGGQVRLGQEHFPYAAGAVAVAALYMIIMGTAGVYDRRILGQGSDEYRRILNGGVRFIAVFALMEVAFRWQIGRSVVLATIPVAIVLSLLVHRVSRKVLSMAQAKGHHCERVVVVGRERESISFIRHLAAWGRGGLDVVAIYTGDGRTWTSGAMKGVSIVPDQDSFFSLARSGQIDTVAVVDQGALGDHGLRDLGWALEGLGVDVMVAPEATDVVGPRLHVRPVAGLPLVHVEEPRFNGPGRMLENVIERVVALVGLVLLLPLLLAVAVAIKLDSAGPVLYRQTRVGRNGKHFTVLKFRSMTDGADNVRDDILHLNETDSVLFKVRSDPRVTRVGRWIRRFSIDEVPQLWNVVRGDMAMVGPRPPLPSEVELYASHVRRRLLVKPGLTGMWQVNGRADLSWEDSVRLDLYYVDNWSLAGDLAILLRTLTIVVRGTGAY